MGLLDIGEDPLMGLATGLLSASGPSRMPVSFGQALGAGVQGMNDYRQQGMQRKFSDMKMGSMQGQMDDEKAKRAALMGLREQLPEQMRPMFDVDPMGFLAQMRKQEEEYTLTPGARRFRGDKEIASAPQMPKDGPPLIQEIQAWTQMPAGPEKDLLGKILQAKTQNGQPAQPYFTPIPTPDGIVSYNNRTGTGAIMPGAFVKSSDSPELQARIAGAKEGAGLEAKASADARKAVKTSDQLLTVAQQASTLLDQKPTGSGAGAAMDAAGRMVGVTSDSSKVASQLETLSGWMVANVPRMEGPQSNMDVENYRTMAAKVGDRAIPVAERKAALSTLVALQQKYRHLNEGSGAPSSPSAGKTATLADISATAKASGKTTAEVTAALRAKGYTIEGN